MSRSCVVGASLATYSRAKIGVDGLYPVLCFNTERARVHISSHPSGHIFLSRGTEEDYPVIAAFAHASLGLRCVGSMPRLPVNFKGEVKGFCGF